MIKIQYRNNINISKPSFTANQYYNTNLYQDDIVSFSNNGQDNTDNSTVSSMFKKVNTNISRFVKNLFGKNDENTINDSQEISDLEQEETWTKVSDDIEEKRVTPQEYEKLSKEVRKLLALNPGMTVEEAEESAAWNEEIKRRLEIVEEKRIQRAIAKQNPTFTEYSNAKLKYMFNKLERETSDKRQSSFYLMLEKNYQELRESGNYTEEESIRNNFQGIQPLNYSEERGVFVYPKDGWYWHSISGCKELSKDRVSLSVRADADLLHNLDKLLLHGEYVVDGEICYVPYDKHTKGYYKTSDSASDWCKRHDPITMYFDEQVSQEMLDAIAEITKQDRRIPNRKLPGALPNKPWIANEPYTTQSQIDSLVDDANEVDKDLARAIKSYLGGNASTGMYHSCEKLLDDYKRYKAI